MSSICSISTERASAVIEDQVVEDFSERPYRRYEDDPDYDPKDPQESVHTNASLPSHVKAELATVDEHPLCCLLTLAPKKSTPIEIAHIVPRAASRKELDLLRTVWNTPSRPAVNAVHNLIYLRADLHAAFDFGHWALFPEIDLLDKIFAAEVLNAGMRRYPDEQNQMKDLYDQVLRWCNESRFNYRFVWIHTASSDPILRRNCASNPVDDSRPRCVDGVEVQSTHTSLQQAVDRLFKIIGELSNPLDEAPIVDKQAFRQHCDILLQAVHDLREKGSLFQDVDLSNRPSWEREAGLLRDVNGALTAMNDTFCRNIMQAVTAPNPSDAKDEPSTSLLNDMELLKTLFNEYKAYLHPYTNFPILQSHVHPLLVIENAGDKIHALSSEALHKLGPEAKRIDQIYRSWHGMPIRWNPLTARKKEDSDVGRDDEASERTTQHDDEGHDPPVHQNSQVSDSPVGRSIRGKAVTRPYNAFDLTSLDSSADTPSLTHGGPDSSHKDSDYLPDADMETNVHHYTSVEEWSKACTVDSTIRLTNDHQLGEDNEASRPPRPQQWKQWATSPPKMPLAIMDRDDTSNLTSYHWSLYHERVNLLAPYGSHEVPRSHFTPSAPRVYDL